MHIVSICQSGFGWMTTAPTSLQHLPPSAIEIEEMLSSIASMAGRSIKIKESGVPGTERRYGDAIDVWT